MPSPDRGRVGHVRRHRLAGHRGELVAGCLAHAEALRGRADDVAEHGAGLHRGQLLGVADQDEPGFGTHRLDQAGHHRERDHRGLVDHDHVVRQPVQPVVPEAGPVARVETEQPVQASGRVRAPSRSRHRVVDRHGSRARAAPPLRDGPPPCRSARPGRRGGGRRPAADACSSRRASTRATVVVLPVPGPPATTETAPEHRRGRRHALEVGSVVVPAEEAGQARGERVSIHAARRGWRRAPQVVRHLRSSVQRRSR